MPDSAPTPQSNSGPPSRFQLVPLSALHPSPDNARKHSKAQIVAIANSIAAFGFNAPAVVDRNGRILAGHARYEGAKHLGMTHINIATIGDLEVD